LNLIKVTAVILI